MLQELAILQEFDIHSRSTTRKQTSQYGFIYDRLITMLLVTFNQESAQFPLEIRLQLVPEAGDGGRRTTSGDHVDH